MNDLYFTVKKKKACKDKSPPGKPTFFAIKSRRKPCISSISQEIVYHQTAGKNMHGYAVMIYSSIGADEMHANA